MVVSLRCPAPVLAMQPKVDFLPHFDNPADAHDIDTQHA
jgi:hypothetical protein